MMAQNTLVFTGPSPEDPIVWFDTDERGTIRASGESSLEHLAVEGRSRMQLVLPGELVTAIEVDLPSRSQREALAAAPYAIEDQIASDPEDIHLVLTALDEAASHFKRTAYVIDSKTMDQWTAAIRQHGFEVDSILPDYLTLPDTLRDTGYLCRMGNRILLRHGHWGATLADDLGDQFATGLLEARDMVSQIQWIDPEAPWPDLCRGSRSASVNLLSGPYAPRRVQSDFSLGQLRVPIALAAGAMLLFMGRNLVEGFGYQAAADAARNDTEQIFRQAFPEVERVVNPRAQMRAQSDNRASSDPDFLILSAWLALALESNPGVAIETLRYDGQTKAIILSVRYGDYGDLESLRRALETQGGRVTEGGSRQAVNGGRIGELTVDRT